MKKIRIGKLVLTIEEWILARPKVQRLIKSQMPKKLCEDCHCGNKSLKKTVYFYRQTELNYEHYEDELEQIDRLTYKTYYGYRDNNKYCSLKCTSRALQQEYFSYAYVNEEMLGDFESSNNLEDRFPDLVNATEKPDVSKKGE